MRLATIRTGHGTRAVRMDADGAVETGHPDVGTLLADRSGREMAAAADGPVHPFGSLDCAPVVPRPGKIICVGLNYEPPTWSSPPRQPWPTSHPY